MRRRHTVWPDSGKRYSSMNAWMLVHGAYPLLLLNYLPVKQQTSIQPIDDTREDRAVLDPFRIGTGRFRFFLLIYFPFLHPQRSIVSAYSIHEKCLQASFIAFRGPLFAHPFMGTRGTATKGRRIELSILLPDDNGHSCTCRCVCVCVCPFLAIVFCLRTCYIV